MDTLREDGEVAEAELESRNRENGIEITPDTARGGWDGGPMDKDMAVEALLRRE